MGGGQGGNAADQAALYLQRARLLNQRQIGDALKTQRARPGSPFRGLGDALRVDPRATPAQKTERVRGDRLPYPDHMSQGRISVRLLAGPTANARANHLSGRLPAPR